MFTLIQQYLTEYPEEPSSDIIKMIKSEYKNSADQEFALQFFKTNSKIPELKDFLL